VIFALRRWRLPFGTVILMVTLNMALMAWMRWRAVAEFLPALLAGPLAALLADFLIWRSNPSLENKTALRILAFALPFSMSLIYLLILHAITVQSYGGLTWRIHMWLGAPFVTGIGGVLLSLSLLAAPPALPD
jgi:hypothetical protein